MNRWILTIALLLVLPCTTVLGLDLSNPQVPREEILSGGPPKDGIPALTDPDLLLAQAAAYLSDEDRILGIVLGDQARAYPIRLLNWHELVNDTLSGEPVLISYCPLCGSGMAFDPRVNVERLNFGVSGRLYNSDLLFYDRKTESLWSQLRMEAVTGPMAGTKLRLLAIENTTWGRWRKQHPETTVLSLKTGYARDYGRDPYAGYEDSPQTYFPVSHRDDRLSAKMWVLGVEQAGVFKAYPFERLAQAGGAVQDEVGGVSLVVEYDDASRTAWVRDPQGKQLASVTAYWFAWAAFHPNTQLFEATVSHKDTKSQEHQ